MNKRPPHQEPPPGRFAESYRFGLCFGLAFNMTPFLILRMWPKAWIVLQLTVLVSGGLFCVIMKLSEAHRVAAGGITAFLLSLTLYVFTMAYLFL
ncbi:hypothetical protein [Acanthopleuribacter pedis]|uniref:Uncharacterized protein n=1 Tax=Acanthopleuribacter pedis TaxID=442870 RepID=A0A8J7U5D1_9BACT|nr:hypothetical protein [Acanthopleuribacter pedis]MBO1320729.1 hypothetical protein [Acanthopleuribacter pedis]